MGAWLGVRHYRRPTRPVLFIVCATVTLPWLYIGLHEGPSDMRFTSSTVVEYVDDFSYGTIPDDVIADAKRLVLDSLGCCLGAYSSPPSKHLRALYGDIPGNGISATVLGSGKSTRVEYAGLINAAMVRYLDFNDAYISEGRACHPSDHIPALISVAETEGRDGTELLEAIVLAYEIEGMGLDTGVTWKRGYDYVTWGAYSSVAAVGKLMGLDGARLRAALGIAGSSNLTLGVARRGEVSMWKGLAHPYVTHSAIQACQMARAGITGPERVFEGPDGFWEVAEAGEVAIDELGGIDGAPFRLSKANIKPYPCGYYMMPMIEGVRDLVTSNEIDPEEIEGIHIETFANAVDVLAGEEKWSTDLTRESADHSIPYTSAIAALHGTVRPQHYSKRYREDPDVHRLMGKVTVEESEDLNAFSRSHPNSTPVKVHLDVGDATYETRIDYAPGHAKNPLSEEELETKMRSMAAPLLTESQIDGLLETTDRLESLTSMAPLLENVVV